MKLKCYNVKCRESDGTVHVVGLMCGGEDVAKHVAENSLFEGKHITAKAFEVEETDRI